MLIATMAGVTALVVLIAVWRVLVPGPSTKLAFAVASTAGPAGPAGSAGPLTSLLPPRSAGVGSSADGSARPRVSVVVPALNEEESIDWVVENIPDWVSEVVLVDGLSIDGTELVVRDRCSDLVIVHQRSRGKGAALRAGFAAASGEIIVMIDADGSTDPREMGRFVDALIDGADFVKGSRNLAGGGSTDFTLLRHLGNLGFVWAANLLFGVRFTDLCYGYCAFWRRDVDRLALTADGFEIEMELILSAIKAGLTIAEVPSMELERRAGDSNLNAWKDGKRVLKTLLRQRVRRLDAARAHQVQVWLSPVMRAAHSTAHWVPAGADRRQPLDGDRRRPTLSEAGVSARDERRLAQRRTAPDAVSEVLVARIAGPADASDGAAASQPVGLVSRSA